MYHYAMHKTKRMREPIDILRAVKRSNMKIEDIHSKEPYVLYDVPADLSSIGIIVASLANDIDMGISEYLSIYPSDLDSCDIPNVAKLKVDTSSLKSYNLDNVTVFQDLYRICNADINKTKYAFDVLLSISIIKKELK